MGQTIVITGGIAMGKSTFVQLMAEEGDFGLFDCDKEVHDLLTSPGILETLRSWFGTEIFEPDQVTLDRSKLGRLVFAEDTHRRNLEALLHPLVGQRCSDYQTDYFRKSPEGFLVIDVPLYYESETGQSRYPHDRVVVVATTPLTQQRRLVSRKPLSRQELLRRIASQKPIEEKMLLADMVIWNEGPLSLLREQAQTLMRFLSP